MLATPIIRPTTRTIYNLGNDILERLFNKRYRNNIIRYNQEDIIKLLNYVSNNSTFIPDNLQTPWGDAIHTIASGAKSALHKIGTRGTSIQQQNKESIVSSLTLIDANNNIMNKKLLDSIVPHKSRVGGNKFINKCKSIRMDFNAGNKNILCAIKTFTRNSLVFSSL